ncbi:formate dehydrogenase oxidoreductase, partial [Escherichia coli]|nr:formate dehydrogenase oxidoreductase [Escherichia coli]
MAMLKGMMKALLAIEAQQPGTLDHEFIAQHTEGFDALRADIEATQWPWIERLSGLTREAIESMTHVYARADRVIICYG